MGYVPVFIGKGASKNMFDGQELQQKVDEIVQDYLYKISFLIKHDYFNENEVIDSRTKYYRRQSFGTLNNDDKEYCVAKEGVQLEGCTRVFLINPIMKLLLERHKIRNDWQNGNTFSDYTVSNREYELDSFLEFIAVLDEKKVGVRYTKTSYSMQEIYAMKRDASYLLEGSKVPGFDKLCYVNMVYVLDWSGIADEELSKIHPAIKGLDSRSQEISIKDFFNKYFSHKEYEIVITSGRKAFEKAKEIIALRVIPQLLPDNMLLFKKTVVKDFSEERLNSLIYEFKEGNHVCGFSNNDLITIKDTFLNNYRNALIGKADFAKSFITSEYLYRTVKDRLSIDYTSIVVGYLKSVEQLLYLLYKSAFEGNPRMEYWDRCKKADAFDITKEEQFRYDPYSIEKRQKQEKYIHKIRGGAQSPEIGELARFLRYFEKMWRISERGKEYVYECLDDFRKYCRNSHFHKSNIGADEYEMVKRIRNNAHVCLYYLLGGFRFLDTSPNGFEQIGIIDYSFESLYQLIRQKGQRYFDAKFQDDSQSVIFYLNNDEGIEYSETGELKNARLWFLKKGMNKKEAYASKVGELLNDKDFVSKHSFYISHDNMPLEMSPIQLKKENANNIFTSL